MAVQGLGGEKRGDFTLGAGQPLHDTVTHAALALALLWDPAGGV